MRAIVMSTPKQRKIPFLDDEALKSASSFRAGPPRITRPAHTNPHLLVVQSFTMSSAMSSASVAKPLALPSRGRRTSHKNALRTRHPVRAASNAPQWSTDKTLYGEDKIDLKEGERLQCVHIPFVSGLPRSRLCAETIA
jgi:hypothetical protein